MAASVGFTKHLQASSGNKSAFDLDSIPPKVEGGEVEKEGEIASYSSPHPDGLELAYSLDQTNFVYNNYSGAPDANGLGGPGYNNIRGGSGDIELLMRQAMPPTKRGKIAKAEAWYEEDDLLQQLVNVKLDFAMTGFGLHCVPPATASSEDQNTEVNKFSVLLGKVNRRHQLRKVCHDLLRDRFVTDSMILYWRVSGEVATGNSSDASTPSQQPEPIPGLIDVCAISPKDVDWNNSIGQDILRVKIPDELRRLINTVLDINDNAKREAALLELQNSGVGLRWIEEVKKGRQLNKEPGFVELRREEGDNWIIRSKARKHNGLATPSMASIFLSLELRRSLIQGDFAAAYMMKHFIMLIQAGEKIDNPANPGDRKNWLKSKEAKELLKAFSNVSKAMRMAVNHTLKISFVYPPKEMFDGAKFENSEKRIYNWAGIVVSVMQGQGGTYSGGFIGIKKLVANLQAGREDIDEVFGEFFDHPTIRPQLGLQDDYEISCRFDENVLKEPAQLLQEVRMLVQEGFLDPYTALAELGRDPSLVKALKKISLNDDESLEQWTRIFEIFKNKNGKKSEAKGDGTDSSTDADANPEGRPANPGTVKNPGTKNQRPNPQPQL